MGLKWYFAFAAAVAANSGVNWFLVKLLKQMVILEAWPPSLGVA